MPQIANTNISSLNAQRNLNTSQSSLATSLQRLSSGLRINSAKDDAAGMAIADRMTSQVRGLNQAARNANDGISLAQTAEGGLSSLGESLQRMRELAIQSANSTNSASDRASLNSEVQALMAEISRVASTTQFNGLNLLDGTFSSSQFQVGANANQTISVSIAGANTNQIGAYQQQGTAVDANAFSGSNLTITPAGGNAVTIGVSVATGSAGNNLITADSAAAKAVAINAKTAETGVTATATNSVQGGQPIARSGVASGVLKINGVSIGAIGASASGVTQGNNAATAINAMTSLTGVSATADTTTGKLTLTASDGRNIVIETTNGAAGARDIQNATGLDASAGNNASGQETLNLTIDTNVVNSATGVDLGDIVTIDNIVYEFQNAATSVAAGRVKVQVEAGSTSGDVVTTLKAAIDAQYALGNTAVVTSGATATNLTLTSDRLGAGTIAATSVDTTALGVGVAGSGVAAADGNGTTTRGSMLLSSGTGFTVGGSEASRGGLSTTSAALATISTVNISTVAGSNTAIALIDGALSQVNSMRANLGAVQNRFTSTVANLSTTAENLSAARSRIQDADFAAETASLTRGQILQQAGVAMLAQANSLPNQVLTLLRG